MLVSKIAYRMVGSIEQLKKFLDKLGDADYSEHIDGCDEPELWLSTKDEKVISALAGKFLTKEESQLAIQDEEIDYILFYE